MAKKTKQEYEIELLALVPQLEKLEKRRSFLWKKIAGFENLEAQHKLAEFPSALDEMDEEQLIYVLYHAHNHPDAQYKFANKIFESLGIFPSGFWEDTKQFAFALHGHTDLKKFKAFYEVIKSVYLPTTRGHKKSDAAINFPIYFDIYGGDGWSLQIDPKDGSAWLQARYDRKEEGGTLDSVLEKLAIFQKCYESSY